MWPGKQECLGLVIIGLLVTTLIKIIPVYVALLVLLTLAWTRLLIQQLQEADCQTQEAYSQL